MLIEIRHRSSELKMKKKKGKKRDMCAIFRATIVRNAFVTFFKLNSLTYFRIFHTTFMN